ncbi:MAG: hypothetical protein AB1782_09040 [Cyanobacteriota bacterium]
MCVITFAHFSYQASIPEASMYKLYDNVIFGLQDFDLPLLKEFFAIS